MAPDEETSPNRPRPIVYGVLGGIASGKSAVAGLLAGPQGRVLAADSAAQEALDSPEIQERLRAAFGPAAAPAGGPTDRRFLARRIFEDDSARRRLEGWIHPIVRARILADFEEAGRQGARRIVLDIPLLLETDAQHEGGGHPGLVSLCDHLVFVDVDPRLRDERAVRLRGWDPGEVARREAAQMPTAEKRARADFVVRNEGSLNELKAAVEAVLAATGAR